MNEKPPPGIARFDSAAAMVQAIGSCLNGCDVASLSQAPRLDLAMPLINRLPPRLREWAYSVGGMTEAVPEDTVRRLDVERISEWITGLLPRRIYPAAFIGSSNGALVHLAAIMGLPWLPQTFLCPVRRPRSDPDDPRQEFAVGRKIVDAFLEHQPGIAIHHMHDPNQDRLMLRTMSYYRLKHRSLPPAYGDLLSECLPAGTTLYVDECTTAWPVTRTSARSVFQFGALGGASAEEYFQGSARVREYLARYRINRSRWDPPEPNDEAPEAEWGFEPSLLEHIRALARAKRWRLMRLRFSDPEALSFLTAKVYRAWYHELGFEPTRLLVDSFVLMDPYRTLRLHALPFWLLFGVDRSATALRRFLDAEPPFDEIGMMLFSHGTEGVGVVGIERWRGLLASARRCGSFLGVDEARYPRDFATFIRFHRALEALGLPFRVPPACPPARFEALVREYGPSFGVRLQEDGTPDGQVREARRQ